MKTLKEMYHARIAWNQQDNIDSTIGEMKLSSSDLKKAQKIINDPKTKGGNYGQAVKDLEKWKKGSTKDKRVADMLYKAHNEALKTQEQIHGHDDNLEKKSKFKKEETEVVVEGKLMVKDFTGPDGGGPSHKKFGLKLKVLGSGRYGGDDVELSGPDKNLMKFAVAALGVIKPKNLKDTQKQIDDYQ